MIKQIAMPTVFKSNGYEAQFIASGVPEFTESHKKRQLTFQERAQEAEKELDEALSNGFILVTQYEVKTDRHEEIVFILHKHNRGQRELA